MHRCEEHRCEVHRCEGFGVSIDSKLHLNLGVTIAKRILRVYWRRGKQHLGSACEVRLEGGVGGGDAARGTMSKGKRLGDGGAACEKWL